MVYYAARPAYCLHDGVTFVCLHRKDKQKLPFTGTCATRALYLWCCKFSVAIWDVCCTCALFSACDVWYSVDSDGLWWYMTVFGLIVCVLVCKITKKYDSIESVSVIAHFRKTTKFRHLLLVLNEYQLSEPAYGAHIDETAETRGRMTCHCSLMSRLAEKSQKNCQSLSYLSHSHHLEILILYPAIVATPISALCVDRL